MNTEQNLNNLFKAVNTLKDLPVMKLAENKTLMKEITEVLNAKNVSSLIDGILSDYRTQKNAEFQEKQTSKFDLNSPEFLRSYSKYQSAVFNEIRPGVGTPNAYAYTSPITQKGAVEQAMVFNQANPFKSEKIKNLDETKKFAEVFNSIYSDHALQIGTAQDPTIIQSYLDYSPYIWNFQYYLSIPTLAQSVDLGIQIANRQMPKFDFDDQGLSEAIDKELKRSKFVEKVRKMLFYSHLSPRGSLIVPIKDSATGRIRFNVFNDTQFTYATSYQYSRIDFKDSDTGISDVYVLGHLLQNEVTAYFLCPGFEPTYAIGKNKLYQMKDAAEAINIYLYTIKVLCIRAQVMVQKWGGEGQTDSLLAQMQQTSDDINSKLSLNTAVKLPNGADLSILNNNFSEGFAEVSPIIKEYQGMLSGVMPDYFYGSDTAYSANSFNIHATHQNIRSQIQEAQMAPIYRFCINKYLELDSRFSKWKNRIDDFDITFESLYEPTTVEKAEIDSKNIDNIIKMAGYPELTDLFKSEGLLKDEYEIPEVDTPPIGPLEAPAKETGTPK